MYSYRIEGNRRLAGTIAASGNKNAALPCIAAALLTDEPVRLERLPDIEDVQVMLAIASRLGASVTALQDGSCSITAHDIRTHRIPVEEASAIRASILFAGPMVARVGRVELPPPGGDVIGRRRLDTHFLALQSLGATITVGDTYCLSVSKRRLVGAELFLDEASVTATENAIMGAVLAEGETTIENAASEPHVQDLCRMLNAMGAEIEGIGSNIVVIRGVKRLRGVEFRIGADYMEVGSFIGLAAATRSELTITNVVPEQLKMMRIVFAKLGIVWQVDGDTLHVPERQILEVVPDLGGMIPKIDDAPWPGFPPDLISIVLVVASQIRGTVLIHEKLFESRMFFVDKLIGMGARIVLCDPHRAVVSGPCRLSGSELISPDVRAGMAMVIAAFCADGESVIRNVYQIERGYERFVERLRSLGAAIRRIGE